MSANSFPLPYKFQKTTTITSTQSWTVPIDVSQIEIILCGGGSGGANGGTSGNVYNAPGGSGSVDYAILTVTPGTAYTITIGAGGTGAPGGGVATLATAGTSSSFGGLMTVAGAGAPSRSGNPIGLPGGKGGAGGFTAVGNTNGLKGIYGLGGGGGGTASTSAGGAGADGGGGTGGSYFRDTAGTSITAGQNAQANTGAGGGGGSNNAAVAGGNGGSGVAIIKYWSAY